jgi:transposase
MDGPHPGRCAYGEGLLSVKGANPMGVSTIGLDIAKHVFQVHGADAQGQPVIRKRLRRSEVLSFFDQLPRCLVGLEACATAHYWARELSEFGHDVRLIPPQYVRPYVKRNKNDAADAEAICEAVTRPTMRFVPIKSDEQQSVLMIHRVRELLVRQQTMTVNAVRAHLAEFGVVVAQGIQNMPKVAAIVRDQSDGRIPDLARETLLALVAHYDSLKLQISALKTKIARWHRSNDVSRRLATIPGVGPITASALSASIANPHDFTSARQFAAWLGLVPRQHSTGGKDRLGSISKRGNPYLRRLLITGAQSVLRWRALRMAEASPWLRGLLERRPLNVVATALANKTARIIWAMMIRAEDYRVPKNVAA